MPERRKYSELGPGAKVRALARRKLNLYVYYGKVKRQPCEVCGATPAEAHHPDYSKPLDVEWLCPAHHREREAMSRIKPSEIKQAQRFSTGIERVDESLVERYREVAEPPTVALAASMRREIDDAFDLALGQGRN